MMFNRKNNFFNFKTRTLLSNWKIKWTRLQMKFIKNRRKICIEWRRTERTIRMAPSGFFRGESWPLKCYHSSLHGSWVQKRDCSPIASDGAATKIKFLKWTHVLEMEFFFQKFQYFLASNIFFKNWRYFPKLSQFFT